MVLIKSQSNFQKTLEVQLINCEINLILNWSANCFISADTLTNQLPKFPIANTKLYVPVVTLSTQENAKLLQELKLGFINTINRNKYQPKVTIQRPGQYFDYLIDPSFQGVNRIFVLSVEDNA